MRAELWTSSQESVQPDESCESAGADRCTGGVTAGPTRTSRSGVFSLDSERRAATAVDGPGIAPWLPNFRSAGALVCGAGGILAR